MSLHDDLTQGMKVAMKAKDSLRLSCIRQIRSVVKNKEIEIRAALDDQGVLAVISTLLKQRREAAGIYRSNAREDLALQEEAEGVILEGFLPSQMDDAELDAIVSAAVLESGATSAKDMGAVMKIVLPKLQGRADGKRVNEMVRSKLV